MASLATRGSDMAVRAHPFRAFVTKFGRHRGGMVGALLLIGMVLIAFFAPYIAPIDPLQVERTKLLQPPSYEHPFGTDRVGRDQLSRVIYGARATLLLGVVATTIAFTLGVPLGLVAGYRGGRLDNVIMRGIDVLLAFPSLLLAIIFVFALGPNLLNAMIAVGIARIPHHARVTRGAVLSAREHAYVEAARSLGGSEFTVVFRHIFPNVVAPNIVIATVGMAAAILTGTTLSFLGVGAQPPTPEWGLMLSMGRNFLGAAPWLTLFPGLAIMVTVLAINLLGDALRDVLDPKAR